MWIYMHTNSKRQLNAIISKHILPPIILFNNPIINAMTGSNNANCMYIHTQEEPGPIPPPIIAVFITCKGSLWGDQAVPLFLLIQDFHAYKYGVDKAVKMPNFVKLFNRIFKPFLLLLLGLPKEEKRYILCAADSVSTLPRRYRLL